jgi:hypothetical protein
VPETKDGRRFWFRGFYVLGEVYLAWWDDRTHLYEELGYDEAWAGGLVAIYAIVRAIARVSRLRFFSTEVAQNVRGQLLVVDYVNEICDMRLRSVHPDGVPDAVVARIADRLAAHAGGAATLRGSPHEVKGPIIGILWRSSPAISFSSPGRGQQGRMRSWSTSTSSQDADRGQSEGLSREVLTMRARGGLPETLDALRRFHPTAASARCLGEDPL